jgi:hypothetical protein
MPERKREGEGSEVGTCAGRGVAGDACRDACGASLPELTGRTCDAGLDLASTTDVATLELVFPPEEDNEPTWWRGLGATGLPTTRGGATV